jgi:hypothetical protein
MAPACPVFPPPRTVILISTESNILTHSNGCRTNILPVTRPKYSSRGFPFTFIFPSPDLKKTLAVDVFLRPVRRCSVFSMSYDSSNFNGCWAECSCCGPLYTFSFLNIARPSGPFGNIPLTAYSIAAVGDLLSKSSKFMLLSPPGYPEWR